MLQNLFAARAYLAASLVEGMAGCHYIERLEQATASLEHEMEELKPALAGLRKAAEDWLHAEEHVYQESG